MKVGIIQSSYIPWRGYFDFIASVDVFIVYDTVQYSKGSWRNRNRIKTSVGPRWLTMHVRHDTLHKRILDTMVDTSRPWRASHLDSFRQSYRHAPHYGLAAELFAGALGPEAAESISAVNLRLIRAVMEVLSIRTPLVMSETLDVEGDPTERLVKLVRAVGGTSYLSGPSASDYLDVETFRAAGLGLFYKSYDYPDYPQGPGPFVGEVTILDLIAHVGLACKSYMTSRSPDRRVV